MPIFQYSLQFGDDVMNNNYTCPFCGRNPEKIVTSLKDETYRVKCPCECMGPPGYTPDDASRKWNNREPLYINPLAMLSELVKTAI